ncbi:GtrA family protein [Bacteroidales bacterium OttesenSCG-928-M11]|nr:GtrA family protein [Bacteroidales bacterium OttesenSCG-928-M11]
MKKSFFIELIKYGIVGVINTLITAVVIWIIMRFIFQVTANTDASPTALSVSNFIGYVAGVINSFVWNRNWTFKSKKDWKKEFLFFVGAFLVCYIPQLILVNLLNSYADFPSIDFSLFGFDIFINHAYICQLIGIIFFTAMNFLVNKYVTFRKREA